MNRLLLIVFLFSSVFAGAQQKLTKADLEEVKNRLEGSFDNEEQSKTDNSFKHIKLHTKEISIRGKNKEGGYWLYVEQAMASNQDKPYRQRIYHLYKKDNETLVTKVYELDEPLRFAGAWAKTDKLKKLTRDSLYEKEGCDIYLTKTEDGDFTGGTVGKGCLSTLKGASYATSEITIYSNMLVSWDRGRDEHDNLVWGPEKGGYRFRKFTTPRKPKED